MNIIDNQMLWSQFAAAIDTFANTLRACPDDLWEKQLWKDNPEQWVAQGFSKFWYLGYHTLFWLDLYLTGAEEGFAPPKPFALIEMQANETLPPTYTRAELLQYLDVCRQRCKETIAALTSEGAERKCSFGWGELPFGELMLYNLRHVQEHGAQMRMFIGNEVGISIDSVTRAKDAV